MKVQPAPGVKHVRNPYAPQLTVRAGDSIDPNDLRYARLLDHGDLVVMNEDDVADGAAPSSASAQTAPAVGASPATAQAGPKAAETPSASGSAPASAAKAEG